MYIRVFGVEESKDEDIRKVLAKDVLEQALASIEHCHGIGLIGNNGSTTMNVWFQGL